MHSKRFHANMPTLHPYIWWIDNDRNVKIGLETLLFIVHELTKVFVLKLFQMVYKRYIVIVVYLDVKSEPVN